MRDNYLLGGLGALTLLAACYNIPAKRPASIEAGEASESTNWFSPAAAVPISTPTSILEIGSAFRGRIVNDNIYVVEVICRNLFTTEPTLLTGTVILPNIEQ